MFSSNLEPGYYEKDQFGIRIEDIVQIVPAKVENDFNGRGALTFKTVTMCPIHTKLINKNLLTEKEVNFKLNKEKKQYFPIHLNIFTKAFKRTCPISIHIFLFFLTVIKWYLNFSFCQRTLVFGPFLINFMIEFSRSLT